MSFVFYMSSVYSEKWNFSLFSKFQELSRTKRTLTLFKYSTSQQTDVLFIEFHKCIVFNLTSLTFLHKRCGNTLGFSGLLIHALQNNHSFEWNLKDITYNNSEVCKWNCGNLGQKMPVFLFIFAFLYFR